MIARTLLSVALLLFAQSQTLLAEYQTANSFRNPKAGETIGKGKYPVNGKDDSDVFQAAINDVHQRGGGHVRVPTGEYHLINIQLKSEVHLLFQRGVTLRIPEGSTGNMFELGDKSGVKNVSIVGHIDRVTIDFTKDELDAPQRAFGVTDCRNFRIANFTINDNRTRFSSIILGWDGVRDGEPMHAVDGLIENITANDAHYGYGCIQAHSGRSITFRNIKSVGGVAVRLETGLDPLNISGNGGLFDVLVENVLSVKGQAALMMQPHTLDHGDIVGRNIQADGSEFAFYISKPFVSNRRGEDKVLTPGSFKSIKVDGVKAIYRDGPIVTRFPHMKYYPKELHSRITRADNGPEPDYRGPSIAAVAIMDPDRSNIKLTNVEAIGFEHAPDVMYPKDVYKGDVKTIGGSVPQNLLDKRKAQQAENARKKAAKLKPLEGKKGKKGGKKGRVRN